MRFQLFQIQKILSKGNAQLFPASVVPSESRLMFRVFVAHSPRLELRRIPYLARLRNLVMEPLFELRESGVVFDKILFLNDVVFTTQDIKNLIGTRNGNYGAACSIDFSTPPSFYDTFAMRDSEGHDALQQTWSSYRARGSRKALLANDVIVVSRLPERNGYVLLIATH